MMMLNIYLFQVNTNWYPSDRKGVYFLLVYNHYKLAKLNYPQDYLLLKMNINGFYNLEIRLLVMGYLFIFFKGGRKNSQLDYAIKNIDLGNIVDFDLKVEYRYNNVLSAYLSGKRLIGGYEIWQKLPSNSAPNSVGNFVSVVV